MVCYLAGYWAAMRVFSRVDRSVGWKVVDLVDQKVVVLAVHWAVKSVFCSVVLWVAMKALKRGLWDSLKVGMWE